MTVSLALAAWVVWTGLTRTSDVAGALLLVYWVLNLPLLGQEAASVAWRYPMLRNTALRFVEPLGAPEETLVAGATHSESGAVSVQLEDVTVVAGGNKILESVSVDIPAGSHIAIVGRSGAGKSSLVGLLLGWHRPSSGEVRIDGRVLDATMLDQLRAGTAWVDPQVQIWNRSLYENLTYGSTDPLALDEILTDAALNGVIAKLPEGMQTLLGEGGGLVSGGEGQRVRLGRAMAHAPVRLVILDEPARGLDHTQRRLMIERARERWKDATLLCITHDVAGTRDFDRVLVIEDGHIVDDGPPEVLATTLSGRYRQLLDAETLVRRSLWASAEWRRFRVDDGHLTEAERKGIYAGS
jgi:ABC-type multidrug transport system fused ATPase/permease subunit